LRKDAELALKAWLRERNGDNDDVVFPSIRGGPLSRDAIERLVAKHTAVAATRCATLKGKRLTPHSLRHSAAMDLLHHGVDRTVIALWLGHEHVETTQMYLHADMHLKEEALGHTTLTGVRPTRYRPSDDLLRFLEGL
jgi:site-specific recombinase XerD